MAPKKRHHSKVRTFERMIRLQALIDAGIIQSADEIPEDAIPARPEFVKRSSRSLSASRRPPYYRTVEFVCTECGKPSTWTAEQQRFWYEQVHGSIYSGAARCQACRKGRREKSS